MRTMAVLAGLACLGAWSCTPEAEPTPAGRPQLLLSKNTANELQGALARMPDVDVTIVRDGGSSITSLVDLRNGKTNVSGSLADVAYLAYAGQLEEIDGRFEELRGMAVVGINTIQLTAPGLGRVRSVEDLRGARVSLGAPGSSTAYIAERMLQLYGIEPHEYQGMRLPNAEAVSSVIAGKVDAAFLTYVVPSQQVRGAMKAGVRLIELAGDPIEEMRTRYPYLKRTLIQSGTYPNQTAPVRTVSVESMLVCLASVDDDVVFRLLEGYFASQPSATPPDLERAPATPIPLHSGAARYYRQRELSR